MLLQVAVVDLSRLAHQVDRYYRKKVEPKTSGGFRTLLIPYGELKKVQQNIDRKLLNRFPIHDSIHSYRKKRDTVTCASMHVGQDVLVKLDIKDFYPSIRPGKVHTMFMNRGCSRAVALLLTELTTFKNQLPQGAPTSPRIANQILTPMIIRIAGVCKLHGLSLSAFGDDIYVSGSNRAAKVYRLLRRIIEDEGYTLNPQKTLISKSGEKKVVTGISVNDKINSTKDYYRKVRALIHNCSTKGFEAVFPEMSKEMAENKLRGMIRHVTKLNPARGKGLLHKFLPIVERPRE